MAEMPAELLEYLNFMASVNREPAFIKTDREGNLIDWGGYLENYGIGELRAGEPAGDQIDLFLGMFPLDKEKEILPYVKTDAGRHAELHMLSMPTGDYALFLDATTQEEQQRLMQQKGNELRISYQNLQREMQKKEILLHCIVHDLAGPLMGIRGGFELLREEDISEKGRKFLEIGLRQSAKQETLIKEILHAFSAELESLESFETDPDGAPDALTVAKEVIEAVTPTYDLNQVNLQLDPSIDHNKDWKVVGEKSRLERVILNLVENALRHSSIQSTVTVRLIDEGDQIMVAIDDVGPGIPPEIADKLFEKFAQGKKGSGKVGLGLYFCRLTVEQWGGEIGHKPRKEGGTRFWFRLPRPVTVPTDGN